jgi:flagellar biosynthesis protein
MSKSNHRRSHNKAVALQYGVNDQAPVIVASGMGYMAEKIIDVAAKSGVPIYEDNSLATVLTRMELGREIPPELYQAVVEIYVYFLHFDPTAAKTKAAAKVQPAAETQPAVEAQPAAVQGGEEQSQ